VVLGLGDDHPRQEGTDQGGQADVGGEGGEAKAEDHGRQERGVGEARRVEEPGAALLGRSSLDKRYHGELEATSRGEMLSALTGTKGSAGYVAIERAVGTLAGRRGSFALQHFGVMARGAQRLTIEVVPDSGTDELSGLGGTMTIEITDGKHFYHFDYTLPSG